MLTAAQAGAHDAMSAAAPVAGERLGSVSFAVSCASTVRADFSRGVALLHDFWYEEATPQFERIVAADPSCAMAHWGIAMSRFHQIWDRPDEAGMASGWREMQAARAMPAKTARAANSTGAQVQRSEMLAWVAFADGNLAESTRQMRQAADLQDKVGQAEVDIPAREMLADILLESGRPAEALAEYKVSMKSSPNRFNGLFSAGKAAEAAGDKADARRYFEAVVEAADHGSRSTRPEVGYARSFLVSANAASTRASRTLRSNGGIDTSALRVDHEFAFFFGKGRLLRQRQNVEHGLRGAT
jgi:tetratricopeptide (TPR) repeat protein